MPDLHILRFTAELPLGRRVPHLFRISDDLFVLEGIVLALGQCLTELYATISHPKIKPSEDLPEALDHSGFDRFGLVPKQLLGRHAVEAQENPSPPSQSQFSGCLALWAFVQEFVQQELHHLQQPLVEGSVTNPVKRRAAIGPTHSGRQDPCHMLNRPAERRM